MGFNEGFIKGLNCCEPEMAPAPLPAGALLPAASPPASQAQMGVASNGLGLELTGGTTCVKGGTTAGALP